MRWLVRFALVAIMPSGGPLKGIAETGVDPFLKDLFREGGRMMLLGVCLSAVVFQVSPLITIGVPLPAFLLPQRLLNKHAWNITTHRIYLIRSTAFLLKTLAGLCWGQDPEVRAALQVAPLDGDPGTFRGDS